MAALQTIRSKGALLVGVLGLALFAFIAEEFFRSLETSSVMERNQVGEVYGKKLSIQDFQTMAEEQIEMTKVQMSLRGQNANLNDQQTDEIREQVWQQFAHEQVINHECEKLGLYVTDGEVQEALRQGNSMSLQAVAGIFGNPQTGRFDLAQLQTFLKSYTKSIQQAQQAQNAEAVEQIQMIKKLWDYTEKQLRVELLSNKYNMLFASGFISNPIAAKASFDERNIEKNAVVAAIPYSVVNDKDIKVTDNDLKAAYEEHKEEFYMPVASRDIKIIDVPVVASATDRAELMKKVQGFQAQLEKGDDAANVIRLSNSELQYSNIALSKSVFNRTPDIAANLDSMAVGSVKAAYYNPQDNTINTMKLIAKEQMPDSILFRQIAAVAATPEARKAQADSILNALNNGASFAELAKKYNQASDSVWLTSNQYESFGMPEETASYLKNVFAIPAKSAKVYASEQGAAVIQVLDRKHMVTKYNVAVVKCVLNFSKKTYEDELSKMNRFLAQNKDLASIEKNAAKNGYMVSELDNYTATNNMIPARIGGSQSKDCARWILDEAEAGQVSRLYECGRANDHLLVAAVTATYDEGYLPWNNSQVKEMLTEIVMQNKKGDKVVSMAKNAKSLADVMKVEGAITDSLNQINLASYPQIAGINVPEPKLAGVIAKTEAGKTSKLLKGAAAAYMVKVDGQARTTEKFDAKAEIPQIGQMIGQRVFRNVFNYLLIRKAGMTDHRYQF